MRRVIGIAIIATLGVGVAWVRRPPAAAAKGALPVVVFETAKGSFEVEFYPTEAPKSVEHILTLVRRNFYNGLRVHRFVEGFVVQFGDPQTRDMMKNELGQRRKWQDHRCRRDQSQASPARRGGPCVCQPRRPDER